jgi:hypothetical protein
VLWSVLMADHFRNPWAEQEHLASVSSYPVNATVTADQVNTFADRGIWSIRVRSAVVFLGAILGLIAAWGYSRGLSKNPFAAMLLCGASGVSFSMGSYLGLAITIPLALAFAAIGMMFSARR